MQEQVLEYFNNYFDGNLTEDTTNEDIMDAVEDLILLTEDVCDSLGLDLHEISKRMRKRVAKKRAKQVGGKRAFDVSYPKSHDIFYSDQSSDLKKERGLSRAAGDFSLSDRFKRKLNRIATKQARKRLKQTAKSGSTTVTPGRGTSPASRAAVRKDSITVKPDEKLTKEIQMDKWKRQGEIRAKNDPEHITNIAASTWYPNNDIIIENVAGQYRAK